MRIYPPEVALLTRDLAEAESCSNQDPTKTADILFKLGVAYAGLNERQKIDWVFKTCSKHL